MVHCQRTDRRLHAQLMAWQRITVECHCIVVCVLLYIIIMWDMRQVCAISKHAHAMQKFKCLYIATVFFLYICDVCGTRTELYDCSGCCTRCIICYVVNGIHQCEGECDFDESVGVYVVET